MAPTPTQESGFPRRVPAYQYTYRKYLAKHQVERLNEFNKRLGEKAEKMSRTIPDPVRIPQKSARTSGQAFIVSGGLRFWTIISTSVTSCHFLQWFTNLPADCLLELSPYA